MAAEGRVRASNPRHCTQSAPSVRQEIAALLITAASWDVRDRRRQLQHSSELAFGDVGIADNADIAGPEVLVRHARRAMTAMAQAADVWCLTNSVPADAALPIFITLSGGREPKGCWQASAQQQAD